MISLDYRTGSGELERHFKPFGVTVNKTTLSFGDASWIGNGPKGSVAIGVERKKIAEFVQSVISKRLTGHQLPGMSEYDYVYIIVEGLWKPGPSGELLVRNGHWSTRYSSGLNYRAIDNYLSTLEHKAGVIVRRTVTPYETVETIVDLYRWWTDKTWEEHDSLNEVYAPAEGNQGRRFTYMPREVSTFEKMLLQLPGMDKRAQAVASYFSRGGKLNLGNSLSKLLTADEEEIAAITYRGKGGKIMRVGPAAARKIIEVLG